MLLSFQHVAPFRRNDVLALVLAKVPTPRGRARTWSDFTRPRANVRPADAVADGVDGRADRRHPLLPRPATRRGADRSRQVERGGAGLRPPDDRVPARRVELATARLGPGGGP